MEVAQCGTKVLVRDLATRKERLFVLVGDPHPKTDQISPKSLTGICLCGHKIDETISLVTPEGKESSYEVLYVLRI